MKAGRHPERKSPYQRYQKTPIQYSSEYYSWREAIRAGRPDLAAVRGDTHSKRFGNFQRVLNVRKQEWWLNG